MLSVLTPLCESCVTLLCLSFLIFKTPFYKIVVKIKFCAWEMLKTLPDL